MAETICARCGRPIDDDDRRPLTFTEDGRRCHLSCTGHVRVLRQSDHDR
ncbi:MAG: hypothetical protein M9906_04480 [Microthrixaceae bacterium]|nr:hypothetical protein [Microthrixaceae bacterium]